MGKKVYFAGSNAAISETIVSQLKIDAMRLSDRTEEIASSKRFGSCLIDSILVILSRLKG